MSVSGTLLNLRKLNSLVPGDPSGEGLIVCFDSMMETTDAVPDAGAMGVVGNGDDVEGASHRVDELVATVEKLEEKLNEVEQFYLKLSKKQHSGSKGNSGVKDKEKVIPVTKKQRQDASRREAAAAKRMQELIRQFGTILRQLSQHKWARPFLHPVDVEGLHLPDYYQVIEKPMDFSTIKNQMEAKDGTEYKSVREICADVRLVFKNAMKYNEERSDVHVMAKTLLDKFEEKWLHFLPRVTEEEKRLEDEEAEAKLEILHAQEMTHAKMARDISNELYEVDVHLDELREMVVQNCRKISVEEKRKLGAQLTQLSPEDITKALEIVAQGNPSFPAKAEEVELDMDAQSETILWRLKVFVKDALENQAKSAATVGDTNNNNDQNNKDESNTNNNNTTGKRKREICAALAKSKKKTKKPSA